MPSFNINQFRSVIHDNNELLGTNKFLVQFPEPAGAVLQDARTLSFYCKTATLPGIGLLTSDTAQYGVGPIERKPYATAVNDCLFQFYVDGDGKIRKWLTGWMKLITNPYTNRGMSSKSAQGLVPYEFQYKDQYAVDITVTVFDSEGKEQIKTTLIEAYPNYIGDTSLDWQEKNNLMTVPVAFTYRDWYESL
jgi:hypothetical protein